MHAPITEPRAEERLTMGADEVVLRLTSEETAGAVTAFEVTIPAGGGPPMLHRHDPFELYRVESGELAFYLADGTGAVGRTIAGAGAVVAIPGGSEHTVRNESAAEARAFVVFSPAGGFDGFIRAAAALAARGEADPHAIATLAEEHGIEMTRPLAEVS